MSISVFEVIISVHPIDRYQNAISRVMLLPELKKVQLQECFTLMTQDSIGHLTILSPSGGVDSEWKHCSSLLSISLRMNSALFGWLSLQITTDHKTYLVPAFPYNPLIYTSFDCKHISLQYVRFQVDSEVIAISSLLL